MEGPNARLAPRREARIRPTVGAGGPHAGRDQRSRALDEVELLEDHADLLHRVSTKLSNLPYPRGFVLPQSLFNEGARLNGPEMQREVRDYILRMLPIHELGGPEYDRLNAENLEVQFANQI